LNLTRVEEAGSDAMRWRQFCADPGSDAFAAAADPTL